MQFMGGLVDLKNDWEKIAASQRVNIAMLCNITRCYAFTAHLLWMEVRI